MGRCRFSLGKWELEVESGVVVGIEWGLGSWVGICCGDLVWGLVGSLDCGWGIVNGYRGRFCLRWGDCGGWVLFVGWMCGFCWGLGMFGGYLYERVGMRGRHVVYDQVTGS